MYQSMRVGEVQDRGHQFRSSVGCRVGDLLSSVLGGRDRRNSERQREIGRAHV